jgi:hypothetical protein
MARAIWPGRWGLNLSVLGRSWPKLDSQELVRSTGQRRPRVSGFLVLGSPLRRFLAQTTSVSPMAPTQCPAGQPGDGKGLGRSWFSWLWPSCLRVQERTSRAIAAEASWSLSDAVSPPVWMASVTQWLRCSSSRASATASSAPKPLHARTFGLDQDSR